MTDTPPLSGQTVSHCYEIGSHNGQPFVAMEILDGTTLKHKINGRALQADARLRIAIEVADALDAAPYELAWTRAGVRVAG